MCCTCTEYLGMQMCVFVWTEEIENYRLRLRGVSEEGQNFPEGTLKYQLILSVSYRGSMLMTTDYCTSSTSAIAVLGISTKLWVYQASSMNPMMHFLTSTDRSFWKAMTSSRKLSNSSGSLWMINSWTCYTAKEVQAVSCNCLWIIQCIIQIYICVCNPQCHTWL